MLRRFAVQDAIFTPDRLFAFCRDTLSSTKSKIRKAERISPFSQNTEIPIFGRRPKKAYRSKASFSLFPKNGFVMKNPLSVIKNPPPDEFF